MDWFIDWVSMRQQHQDSDIVGKNVCVWLDSVTGERLSEGVGYLSHEGSFSTAVSIRAYGGLVEWSGNPSRWGRADNVFGYTSLRDCVYRVINPHLREYGLPEFTTTSMRSGEFQRDQAVKRSMRVEAVSTTAQITRVDLCRNLATGGPSELAAYIRAASAAVYRGKPAAVFPGSVAWGNQRNSRLKMYDKGKEILDHTNKRSPNPNNIDLIEYRRRFDEFADYTQYRAKLAQWCIDIGLLRHEITLGRQALRSVGLRSWDEWSDARAFAIADERFAAMQIGCSVGLENSYRSFVDAGFGSRRAATLSGVVSRWYMGEPTSLGVSRATWYRYKGDIKAVLGIDISSSPDVAVLNTRVRTVELRSVTPPPWYRQAA